MTTSNPSPLEAISAREAELHQRVQAARQQAEANINAAKTLAQATLAQAEADATAEASQLYRQTLAQTKLNAESILLLADAEAANLRHQAQAKMAQAVCRLVELILTTNSTPPVR